MSGIISSEIPPVPEFTGDVKSWIREISIYIERILRDHHEELKSIYSNELTLAVTGVSGTAPLASSGGTTPILSIPAATSSVNGYLKKEDWTTFNAKQAAGSYLTNLSISTPTNLTGFIKGNGSVLSVEVVSATAPVVYTDGVISIPMATSIVDGYLDSCDWQNFNNKADYGFGANSFSGTGDFTGGTITGSALASTGTLGVTGLITATGGIKIGTLTGILTSTSGSAVTAVTKGSHEADAKTDYTAGDLDTEAETIMALNATNTKINSLIAKLETIGILAAS
jgi:hypothetical protein